MDGTPPPAKRTFSRTRKKGADKRGDPGRKGVSGRREIREKPLSPRPPRVSRAKRTRHSRKTQEIGEERN